MPRIQKQVQNEEQLFKVDIQIMDVGDGAVRFKVDSNIDPTAEEVAESKALRIGLKVFELIDLMVSGVKVSINIQGTERTDGNNKIIRMQ